MNTLDNDRPSAADGTACCVCGTTEARPWRSAGDNILGGDERFGAVRCVRCGTVRLQPRPSPEEMGRHYTATTYARAEGGEETAELGKRLDTFFDRQAERALAAYGDSRPPGRLLDVGCGDGRFLAAIARRGWTVEGIETEPAAANLARRRTGATIHETPLEESAVSEGAFEMVSLLHVLEHVPDPRATLSAARCALAPGGMLLLALPNVWCAESALFGNAWYPLDLPRHYWGFTPHTLTRLVEECGFDVSGVRYFPFLFAPQSVRYVLRGASTGSSDGAAPAAGGGEKRGSLKTRVFEALLNVSERLGHHLPGEVMELAAFRTRR